MSLSKNRRQVLSAIGDFILDVLRVAGKLGQSKDDSPSHLLGELRSPQGFVLFGGVTSPPALTLPRFPTLGTSTSGS